MSLSEDLKQAPYEPEAKLRTNRKARVRRHERHTLPAATNVAFQSDDMSIGIKQLEGEISQLPEESPSPRIIESHEIPSTPVQIVYMEVKGGFRPLDSRQLDVQSRQSEPVSNNKKEVKQMMSDLAILWHSKFVQLCKLSHGLLAGLALCHCLFIFALSPPNHTWDDFLMHYTSLAHGFQAVFYFFNVICVISAFDRYDLSSANWGYFVGLRKVRLGVLTTVLYPLSLLLTLCITNTDDRLGLYMHTNTTIWWEQTNDMENVLLSWRSISLVRGIGIIIAWFLFGISYDDDLLKKHLKEIK